MSKAERENEVLFKLFLQAATKISDRTEKDSVETFFAPAAKESLTLPWKSPQELLSLFRSLSLLLEALTLESSDLIAKQEEIYYSCVVRGKARRSGKPVLWKFAGRVRFKRGKITACVLYADFISLFKQVGSLPGEEAENSDSLEPESIALESQAELMGFESVDSFLGLCEASHLPAVVTDLEDKILDLNDAFAAMLGREASELRDSPIDRIIFSNDLELNKECRRELLEGRPMAARVEFRLLHDSSVVWAILSFFHLAHFDEKAVILRAFSESSRVERTLRFLQEERAHLSRELHDGLAQDAAALWMFLSSRPSSPHPSSQMIVKRMSSEAHQLLARLRNPVQEGSPLRAALDDLVARYRSENGLRVDLQLEGCLDDFHSLSLVAFRIVQEALQNVLSHSGVLEATVVLKTIGSELHGEVCDKGGGFDPEKVPRKSFGLVGMRERCEILGGKFTTISNPLEGTTLRFCLPMGGRFEKATNTDSD